MLALLPEDAMMATPKAFIRNWGGTAFLLFALTLSLGLNVYFARRVGLGRSRTPALSGIKTGTRLPVPFSVTDQHGKTVALTFTNEVSPTVLYILSPFCSWCKRNEANINALRAAAGTRYEFVGLSMESEKLAEYIAEKHPPFPIYVLTPEMKQKFGFGLTPETVIVGTDGTVQKSWQGAYQGRSQQEIEQYFEVKLPGLQKIEPVARPVSE